MTCTASILSRRGAPVQRIVLRMPDRFRFRPGQYLEVLHPDGPVPMSIASAPHRLPELHLHYAERVLEFSDGLPKFVDTPEAYEATARRML